MDFHDSEGAGKSGLLLFDSRPDSVDISQMAYDIAPDLWRRMLQIIAACPCRDSCPRCVDSPMGDRRDMIDKQGALRMLKLMTSAKKMRTVILMPMRTGMILVTFGLLIACDGTAPESPPQAEPPALTRPVASQSYSDVQRPVDIAAHVFDHAVHAFLRDNAAGIGRGIQAGDERRALSVTDDEVYQICVATPESFLRRELAKLPNATGDDPASQYAVRSALECLSDYSENYQGSGSLAQYDQRILVHIIGAALPSALLSTDYYGYAGPSASGEAARANCFAELAGRPATLDNLSLRISNDIRDAWECPRFDTD